MSATATRDAGIERPSQPSRGGDTPASVHSFVQEMNTPGTRTADTSPSASSKDVPNNFTSNDTLLRSLNDSQSANNQTAKQTPDKPTDSGAATTQDATRTQQAQATSDADSIKTATAVRQDTANRGEIQQRRETQFKPDASPELAQSRQHLLENYNAGQPDANLRREFQNSMRDFENRAGRDGLSYHEVAQTYQNVDQMLSAKNPKVSGPQQNILAANVMDHAAHPENISQGDYGTCTATSIENRLFTKNPSIASDMVKQIATNGTYHTPDGHDIDLRKTGALTPRPESNTPYPKDGDRSFATQMMNNAIMNDMTLRREFPQAYVQLGKTDFEGKPLAYGDSGTRVMNEDGTLAKNPLNSKEVDKRNGVTGQETADELHRLTGNPDAFLKYSAKTPKQEIGSDGQMHEMRENYNHKLLPSHEQTISSQEQLESKLAENQRKGNMPLLLDVDGYDRALNHGQIFDKTGGHILSIKGYDPATKQVYVDNNWQKQDDGWIKTSDLYRAMTNANK